MSTSYDPAEARNGEGYGASAAMEINPAWRQ